MPLGNFTVTDSNTFVTEGQQLPTSVILTITPNQGFVINATDFAFISAPSQINVAASTFTQDGTNVKLTAVFANPSLMPSSNLEIPLCISGVDALIQLTLSGTFEVTAINATPGGACVIWAWLWYQSLLRVV